MTVAPPQRRKPRTHWALLALMMMLFLFALVVSGVVEGQVGEGARTPASQPKDGQVPPAFLNGGPIVDSSQPEQGGLRVPDKHVVLTFDDGPTEWTEEILHILRARGVRATFFVVGARAAARLDLVRRMYAEGHEVGIHTFTHSNLANVDPRRARLELDPSQLAVVAATGHTTSLLRLPYSSKVADVSFSEWQAMRRAEHYRVVYADLDTQDWQKQGVDAIVGAGLPHDGKGAVVMLHDGGGDRSQTVAAVDSMITELQGQGYSFDTVTSAVGLPSPWHAATAEQRVRGQLVSGIVRWSGLLVDVLEVAFVVLVVLALLRLLLLVMLAHRHHRAPLVTVVRRPRHWPAVSVVVPAYNEELGIAATVRSLIASGYPDLDIIVVDDGSIDRTAEVVAGLGLPQVRLIRQANGGKPAALNAGIQVAKHDIVVLVDADTVFEPGAVRALIAPFATARRSMIGAASGNTKVGNRRGLLGLWQHLEYVIGFNLDRRMYDTLQCMPTVPGAIGAFRREALEAVGGVSAATLAEDTDLTMAICRAGWRVIYVPEAWAWTEAPGTLRQLWRQRYRWCYGTMQAIWKHRGAVREPGTAGMLGRRGLPYLLAFHVMLPLLAPLIDIATLYSVVVTRSPTLLYVWLGFTILQLLAAGYAFRLDGERLRPLWSLPLQQIVYRQLMYMVVIQSLATALYGLRLPWQGVRRTGEMDAAPVARHLTSPPRRARDYRVTARGRTE
jgi:cellulose synthase/poly-beta-1,6-N-acetylglucosamine synthase-like glycosyltransferase/peptidoglycan/xylan/chitin deacetylase (PgdA/CDA1 family)